MKKNLHAMLFSTLLLLLVGCNGYEDGPAISLRSKHERMRFSRPITKYTVQGVDSLGGLMDIIRAECPSFIEKFTFDLQPGQLENDITWSPLSTLRGSWRDYGDLQKIAVRIAWRHPFRNIPWDVRRLSNRELWLQSTINGITYELRFEE